MPVSELEKNAEKMISKKSIENSTLRGISLTKGA